MNVPNTPPSTRQDQTFSLADGIVAFGLPLRAVRTLHRLHSTAASGRAGMRPSPPFLITGDCASGVATGAAWQAAKSIPFTVRGLIRPRLSAGQIREPGAAVCAST